MNITEAIEAFFNSQAGQLAVWVLLAPLLDFALGVSAAVRDGTFQLDHVAAFLRKHVAGRIIPIWLLLFVGYFADQWLIPVVNVPAISAIGIGAAGLYVLETVGSIMRSWGPAQPVGEPQGMVNRDAVQPVPQD